MFAILYLLGAFAANLFTSRRRLEVENLGTNRILPCGVSTDLALARPARFVPHRSDCHDPAVASSRVSGLLALEV
jgi:hypothetical protein